MPPSETLCPAHSGLVERIEDVEQDVADNTKAISIIRNRPTWAVSLSITALVSLSVGLFMYVLQLMKEIRLVTGAMR